jgi:hypothetical protein
MRLLSRLEDERKSGAIWYKISRQSPKETLIYSRFPWHLDVLITARMAKNQSLPSTPGSTSGYPIRVEDKVTGAAPAAGAALSRRLPRPSRAPDLQQWARPAKG